MEQARESVYVGDIFDSKEYGDQVDTVVTVCGNYTPHTDQHIELKDSSAVDTDDFREAVDTVLDILRGDESVLVHCTMGVSRGPTVLAAALAIEEDTTFDVALESVEEVRSIVNPIPEVEQEGREYVLRKRQSV